MIRELGVTRMLLLFGAGVVLLVCSWPSGGSRNTSGSGQSESASLQQTDWEDSRVYVEGQEKRLEKILSEIQGVGKVQVMMTVDRDPEDSDGFPRVQGVLVIAQGAGDSLVEEKICEAVEALFPIGAHKIRVMKYQESKQSGG